MYIFSTLNISRLQICITEMPRFLSGRSRDSPEDPLPVYEMWHLFFFIKFSIRKLFVIIPNSLADVNVHLPLIRQQIAVSLQPTVEIMPVSIFSPLFKKATGCRWVKVADLKTEKKPTQLSQRNLTIHLNPRTLSLEIGRKEIWSHFLLSAK